MLAGSSKLQPSTSRPKTIPQPSNSNRSVPHQRPAIDTAVPSTYTRIQGISAHKQQNTQPCQASSTSSHSSSTHAETSTIASVSTAASSCLEQHSKHNCDVQPLSPAESLDILGDLFHLSSHVLALHDFTPLAPNATCLSFRAGQVILVHNRDPSGWWDGELEDRRGWFPSNYVSGLDQIGRLRDEVLVELRKTKSNHGSISSLASWTSVVSPRALSTRSISPTHSLPTPHRPLLNPLLHAVSLLNRAVAGRRQAHYQPSTACVISCVRSLLMSTECLHRDDPVLKRVSVLARERKIILGNLATLVAQARRWEDWQDSVRQADVEQQDWELEQMLRMGGEVLRNVSQFLDVCEAHGVELPIARRSAAGSIPPVPALGRVSTASTSISSMSSFSSSSGNSTAAASFPSGPCSPAQVLSALRYCNDALLSAIAAFIGHVHSYGRHSHASSKGHLIELARETIDMVRQLLTIVEAVARHPDVVGRSMALQAAKASLFDATNELVESVRSMTGTGSISSSGDSEEEERGRTLQGATGVLKVAGDCVAAVKVCLSRPIGGEPFVVCLPSLSAATDAARTRVSYLRRRSMSVTGITTIKAVQEAQMVLSEADITIQAVEVPEETEAELKVELARDRSSVGSQSDDEDECDSRRSRRSSIAETTPATSVMPEDKDVCSPLEEKLLRGDLPTPPGDSVLANDYDERDITYNSEGAIVGATLDVMIEKMTPHDALVEPAFQQIFMMTWRLFMSPPDFVAALINRYNITASSSLSEADLVLWTKRKSTPVKLRVANLIKTWLENYWRAETDDQVLTQLSQFIRGTISQHFPGPATRILDIIRARALSDDSLVSARPIDRTKSVDRFRETPAVPHVPVSPSDIPRPTITKALFAALKNKHFAGVTVTDFDVLELARQFTIMESKLYLKVLPEELLELGQSGGAPAVNVKSISSLSTAITGWVTECILNESDAKKRTNLVKFFIKVADRCSSLNNFSTSRSILAALDSSTISRLYQTWTTLSQKSKVQLESLRKMADHARNYSEYRSRLRNTSPPAVPFLGLYLTDITFCREGNPDYRVSPVNRPLINFNKYHKLARIVQDMQRFQVQYNLKEIPEVQQYLMGQFEQAKNAGDLHDLYRRSLLVEPRRPADASISSSDGKQPLLQIWGLGTLSRAQGSMLASKNAS
ncbi:ras guanine nucleotide exchange factor domain-containing protein [Hysterangium stoloniferum]|nr:ras guanine nucleotide exchange factor domain-containing protein [Hysterangium stoloniferum]